MLRGLIVLRATLRGMKPAGGSQDSVVPGVLAFLSDAIGDTGPPTRPRSS